MMGALLVILTVMIGLIPPPLINWIVGGILAAIAFWVGLAVACLTQINSYEKQISEAQDELTAARDEFDKAAAEVMEACGPECWDALNQPPCP